MTTTSKKDDQKANSFLDQTQLEGKATGEVKVDLEQALADVAKILPDAELKDFGKKGDEDWDSIRFAIYCQDCRSIVPAGIGKGHKGKMRTVCGACNSRKIASGREEALKKFYGIEDREDGEAPKERRMERKKDDKKGRPPRRSPRKEKPKK